MMAGLSIIDLIYGPVFRNAALIAERDEVMVNDKELSSYCGQRGWWKPPLLGSACYCRFEVKVWGGADVETFNWRI